MKAAIGAPPGSSKVVREVFQLVDGGHLLVPAAMPADVLFVTVLSTAKTCAWEATSRGADTWSDVRELHMAEVERDALAVDGMEDLRSAIWELAERMLQPSEDDSEVFIRSCSKMAVRASAEAVETS